jgi:hypothetical protein
MAAAAPIALPRPKRDSARGFEGWPSLLTAFSLAGALALVAVLLGWRGSDLPAQVFRSELFRQDGFTVWNSQWFGGHPTLPYSVISPALGAITGPVALGAVTCVISAVLFERILRFAYGRAAWTGAIWFALGSVTNLIVGRVTFSLGVALGLAAVYALQRKLLWLAIPFALLCSLSSPLAGAFLALGALAWALGTREHRAQPALVVGAALAPILAITVLFPNTGNEPYELWALIWDLALAGMIATWGWRTPIVRWGAVLYACTALGSFVVPTALGGNVSRLGQYVGGPILACMLVPRRRLVFAALAIPLLVWQWYPAVDAIAFAPTDPSTKAAYYTPVVSYLESQSATIGRVEIPSTYRHWEAAYAAPQLILARGWERQLDIAYNPIFYEGPLTAQTYHQWLTENGVQYIALPDARLDDSSIGERALLLGGLPYLEPMWHNAHWQVWRVKDFTGLTTGVATLVKLSPDRFTLSVHQPGNATVRVRASSHWDVHGGNACVESTPDGWTELVGLTPGTVEVTQSLVDSGDSCS